MKKSFMKFLSNDKNPNEAKKNQNKNKMLIFGGLIIIVIALTVLSESGGSEKPKEEKQIGSFNLVEADKMAQTKWVGEAGQDLTIAKKRVDELERSNNALNSELNTLKKVVADIKKEEQTRQNNYQKSLEGLKQDTNNRLESLNNNIDREFEIIKREANASNALSGETLYKNFPQPMNTTANNAENPQAYGLSHLGTVPELKEIEQVRHTPLEGSLVFTNVAKPKPKEEDKEKKSLRHIIPTGSIVRAVLLSGIDAPTMTQAKTEPLPVLMKVTDLSILPNQWAFNINECFLMGEGYGDLTSERAYVRVNNISCVTDKGKHIDMAMKGAVSGEDGKLGLRGEVVTKQGALLARTLVAGFLQGVGESFANQNQIITSGWGGTTTTTGTMSASESLQAGAFQGLSESAEKLADFYLKMADQVHPVIEISAGREVNVLTTATLELKTLQEMEESKNKGSNNNSQTITR